MHPASKDLRPTLNNILYFVKCVFCWKDWFWTEYDYYYVYFFFVYLSLKEKKLSCNSLNLYSASHFLNRFYVIKLFSSSMTLRENKLERWSTARFFSGKGTPKVGQGCKYFSSHCDVEKSFVTSTPAKQARRETLKPIWSFSLFYFVKFHWQNSGACTSKRFTMVTVQAAKKYWNALVQTQRRDAFFFS
jgi:hypothetical protein